MNGEKILKNLTHATIIATMSYFTTHPESSYLWLMPGITWLAQCMSPPDVTVGK
jgi:hypothetical protein